MRAGRAALYAAAVLAAVAAAALAAPAAAGQQGGSGSPYLYVSAAGPDGRAAAGHFAGAMVVEVVVRDPDLRDTGGPVGEPDVTVGGSPLRMVQGADGAWYAYFADADAALYADGLAAAGGGGPDFGRFCSPSTPASALGASFGGADAVAVPRGGGGGTDGPGRPAACSGPAGGGWGAALNSVVRRPAAMNENPAVPPGQIGLDPGAWPAVQLFKGGDAAVRYERGGGGGGEARLEYGEMPEPALALDRERYPAGAEVFVSVADAQLGLDPTDEDRWTFGTGPGGPAAFYMAFGGRGSPDLAPHLGRLGFEDGEGLLEVLDGEAGRPSILGFKPNANQPSASLSAGAARYSDLVTLAETGRNTGVFESHDGAKSSTVHVLPGAPRGNAAAFRYGESTLSAVTGPSGASVSLGAAAAPAIAGGAAAVPPGTPVRVELRDADLDLNAAKRDVLDSSDPAVKSVPVVRIGSPLTLAGAAGVEIVRDGEAAARAAHSAGADGRLTVADPGPAPYAMVVDAGYSAADLRAVLADAGSGTNWLNYDLRAALGSAGADLPASSVSVAFGSPGDPGAVVLLDGIPGDGRGLARIPDPPAYAAGSGAAFIVVRLGGDGEGTAAGGAMPVVLDVASFGAGSWGSNAAYRVEMEETGRSTGVFAGTVERAVMGPGDAADPAFVASLRTHGDEVRFAAGAGAGSDEITVSYADAAGGAGERGPVAAGLASGTHSGAVSLGSPSYRFGQPVTVTLRDPDLNTDGGTVESYAASEATDAVGAPGGGILLEVTIKGHRYRGCTTADGVSHGGLGSTGFALVETGPATGVFEGSFKMPSRICSEDGTRLVSPAGGRVDAKYYDFLDGSGNPSAVSASAGGRQPAQPGQPGRQPEYPLRLDAPGGLASPAPGATAEVRVSGRAGGGPAAPGGAPPVAISVAGPAGPPVLLEAVPDAAGRFEAVVVLRPGAAPGEYRVDASRGGERAGSASFELAPVPVPEWVRQVAMLRGEHVSDAEVRASLRDMAGAGLLPGSGGEGAGASVPQWVKRLYAWWGDGLLGDSEMLGALRYLIADAGAL